MDTEQLNLHNHIATRLNWLERGEEINVAKFAADVRSLLDIQHAEQKDIVDAHRYRWLRVNNIVTNVRFHFASGESPYVYAEELDQAIDANMGYNPLEAPRAALPEDDKTDAARWRALLNSARIRPIGSAGIKEPEENYYAHLGLELWTLYGKNLTDEWRERLEKENALGREWLIGYADLAELANRQRKP